jgi:hypothetical protein
MTQLCITNWKEVRNDRPMSDREWIQDILEGHHKQCQSISDEYKIIFNIV